MTYFATFNADGLPQGFYIPDIHGPRTLPVYTTPEATEDDPNPVPVVSGSKPNPDCKIPADAVEITDAQWQEFIDNQGKRKWQDGEVVEYERPIPLPTSDDVNRERDRRILIGATIDGIAVTGRDEDARNLTNLALASQLRIASGDTTTITVFRDGNNVDHNLTPAQMLDVWQKSAAYASALYAASWVIKAMDPLPDNIADDQYWTVNN